MKRFLICTAVFAASLGALPALAQNATLDAAAKEAGAVVTKSGLVFRSLKDGSGATPGATDVVKVHYKGTFPDGKEFDSSYSRGTPIEFPLGRVIPCWTEGVQKMKVGGAATLTWGSTVRARMALAQYDLERISAVDENAYRLLERFGFTRTPERASGPGQCRWELSRQGWGVRGHIL